MDFMIFSHVFPLAPQLVVLIRAPLSPPSQEPVELQYFTIGFTL